MAAEAYFCTFGTYKWVYGIGRCASVGVYPGSGASGIVTVKPISGVEIIFRLIPGSENETNLRADNPILFVAGVGRIVTLHIKIVVIPPQAQYRTELLGPRCLALRESAEAGLLNFIAANRVKNGTRLGPEKSHIIDAVMAHLSAQGGRRVAAQQAMEPAVFSLAIANPAAILLEDLIAVNRIVEKEGEVGLKIQIGMVHRCVDAGCCVDGVIPPVHA